MDELPQPPILMDPQAPVGPPPLPAPGPRPDPGSPRAARFALIAALVLILTTFGLQQWTAAEREPPAAAKAAGISPPGLGDQEAMSLRMLLKLGRFAKDSGGGSPATDEMLLKNLDDSARTPEHQLRAAIVAAELSGGPAAAERLKKLDEALEDRGDHRLWKSVPEENRRALAKDARTLIRAYESTGPLDPDAVADLEARHGYFARVAGVWGKPDSDPERKRLLGGGASFVVLLLGAGALGVSAVLGGIAAFIVACVLLATGRIRRRFVPPAPGGSVYLETVAVFFLGFLAIKVGVGGIVAAMNVDDQTALFITLGVQWALVPVVAWPLVRGVRISRWRQDIGLHAGDGFGREVLCGIGGYLAGLPIMLAAMLFTVIVVIVKAAMAAAENGGEAPPPMENPILELVARGGITPWLLFVLATVWAPLVEETVFRGSLYRHLRSRLGVLTAAALTALAFGVAHGYEWLMLGPVIAIGFNFSLMREWRGSLIGPITAHCLHNATVLLLVIGLFTMLKE